MISSGQPASPREIRRRALAPTQIKRREGGSTIEGGVVVIAGARFLIARHPRLNVLARIPRRVRRRVQSRGARERKAACVNIRID